MEISLENLYVDIGALRDICTFLCCCRSFNPSLCRLSPSLLPLCHCSKVMLFVEIYPNRASLVAVTDILTTCAEVITF